METKHPGGDPRTWSTVAVPEPAAGRESGPGPAPTPRARSRQADIEVTLGRFLIFLFFPLVALAGALRLFDADLGVFPPRLVTSDPPEASADPLPSPGPPPDVLEAPSAPAAGGPQHAAHPPLPEPSPAPRAPRSPDQRARSESR